MNEKEQLFKMALNGEPRPNTKRHKLGRKLSYYTAYDPEFDKEIRKLRPDWFSTKYDSSNVKKQQLLEMAKNGEARPQRTKQKHPLGDMLYHYTNSKSKSYDKKFDEEIRKLRPDWFITIRDKAIVKKQQLLEMARNGEARPNFLHKNMKISKDFSNNLKELRPDWFVDTTIEKKEQLLALTKKPHHTEYLYRFIYLYTNPKSECYDEEFDKKIRSLKPHWF